jgi:hypothetical protein
LRRRRARPRREHRPEVLHGHPAIGEAPLEVHPRRRHGDLVIRQRPAEDEIVAVVGKAVAEDVKPVELGKLFADGGRDERRDGEQRQSDRSREFHELNLVLGW